MDEESQKEPQEPTEIRIIEEVEKMTISEVCRDGAVIADHLISEDLSGEESESESSDDEDDEEGWITPKNIAEVKSLKFIRCLIT